MDGFSFHHFCHHGVFGILVIPQAKAKALWDGKCGTAMVGHVGCLGLNSSNDMMKSVYPVVGDGLENVEELFLQGEEVIFVRLADDRRLVVLRAY